MAESADGQEKTEAPSEKRLREAREKGQVARSRELATVLLLLGAGLYFYTLGDGLAQQFAALLHDGLSFKRDPAYDMGVAFQHIGRLFLEAWGLLWPFLAVMTVLSVAASIVIGGWNFAPRALAPNFAKLNPISGLKRLFSLRSAMELVKALLKVLLVGVVAAGVIWSLLGQILQLGQADVLPSLAQSGELLTWAFILISLSLIVVAMIDVPYQLWSHMEQLKMTRQELKEEHKQQEGDPQIRARIRQAQREMAQRRMLQQVPEADVVVTNPTHFAVALKYDPASMNAPVVLARGEDQFALQIRAVARRHAVPVIEAPALARALYYSTPENSEIPEALYRAVVVVLRYVYSLRDGQPQPMPDFEHLPVPEELADPQRHRS